MVVVGDSIGEIREQHLQRGDIEYLQVLEVKPGSSAADAGLLAGDVIYSINKQLARSFDEALGIVAGRGGGMILNIQRDNRELYLLLK